jgi:hypothetical protein
MKYSGSMLAARQIPVEPRLAQLLRSMRRAVATKARRYSSFDFRPLQISYLGSPIPI